MTEPEPEICWKCKQPKPIHLELRNEKTGETRFYCREDAYEWAESNEPWPPNTDTPEATINEKHPPLLTNRDLKR